MKRFVAALLVFVMIFALSATAMAATKYVKGDYVVLKRDAKSYSAAKASKATGSVAEKGSVAKVVKECGDFVKVRVAEYGKETTYFKKCDVKPYTDEDDESILVYWVKGGKGMSHSTDWIDPYLPEMTKVKVTGHTNLRKTNSLECKSQGVVKKCDVLKFKGKMGYDDRGVGWFKVCYKGKTLWLSTHFSSMPYCKKK